MRAVLPKVALSLALLWGSLAPAAAQSFDGDIVITSAMNLDGVWTITVKDFSRNKTASFDTSKNQTKIGLKLVKFDPDACSAVFDSFRGRLNVALASPNLGSEDSELGGGPQGDAYSEASEEILAAMEGKVTKKYRASLWRRLQKNKPE